MRMTVRLLAATMLVLSVAVSAQALTITPSSGVLLTSRWEGAQTGQAAIDAAIAPILGSATELYKADVGSADSGTLAGSYSTVYSPATDPSGGVITYGSGQFVGPTAFALVKDGNQDPAWYLFNLTLLGWDGTDTLTFSSFWPAQGAISHITLYGTPDDPQIPVPDGGSLSMLLGAALMGLAGARRMLA